MLIYPDIDPILVQLGPLNIHWYGVMYLIGFALAWWLGWQRAQRADSVVNPEQMNDLLFYGALGVVIGGRLGYIVFYHFSDYLSNPLEIFKIWQGGMSFHGGLIGVLVAMGLYGRHIGRGFFEITDFIAPLIPPGLAAGRIGNFINGELWGRPTDLPWGMVFFHVDTLPRHPSQLYEFLLEGVVLFLILWFFSQKSRPTRAVSGLFLIGYGSLRFLVEFARQPDAHLSFIALGWLTMGQILSIPMIIIGIILMIVAYRSRLNA